MSDHDEENGESAESDSNRVESVGSTETADDCMQSEVVSPEQNATFWNWIADTLTSHRDNIFSFVQENEYTAWIQEIVAWGQDASYEESPEYKGAMKAWREFECRKGVAYESVVEFAKTSLQRCEKIDEGHDAKANSIIQYLSGGTALVTFGIAVGARYDSFSNLVISFSILVSLRGCLSIRYLTWTTGATSSESC